MGFKLGKGGSHYGVVQVYMYCLDLFSTQETTESTKPTSTTTIKERTTELNLNISTESDFTSDSNYLTCKIYSLLALLSMLLFNINCI